MGKNIKNNNLIAKLICLMLSVGLWIYVSNVENRIREYKLDNIPVEIVNDQVLEENNLALTPNQKIYVSLNLEGPSNEVYKVKKEEFKIVVNLANYALKKGDNNVPIEILKYPNNINIRNNSFLRVNVKLDNYVEKNIPIESNVKISTKQGTYVDKTIVSPTNAMVMGTEEYVNKVKRLIISGEVNNMVEETKMQLPVVPVDEKGHKVENVSLSVSIAEVIIPVKKGKEVPIKVITEGALREGLISKSITPEPAQIELLGDKVTLDKINFVETEPINLSQFDGDSEISIIIKIPENTTTINDISQIKVKFTFDKITSKIIEVPVVVKGIPEDYDVKTDTEKVSVKISGMKNVIDNIDVSSIKCEVDVATLPLEGGEVNVAITNPYENINLVEVSPKKIKIEFIKKPVIEEENSTDNQ